MIGILPQVMFHDVTVNSQHSALSTAVSWGQSYR